jgi:hypothetical protein
VFTGLVNACDRTHFEPSDVPLLSQYAEAVALAEWAAAELQGPTDGKWLAVWEKATRVLTALSIRLRLSPQARRERAQVRLDWSTKFGL